MFDKIVDCVLDFFFMAIFLMLTILGTFVVGL